MSWIKSSVVIFTFSLFLLVATDNLIHTQLKNNAVELMTIDFRHAAYEDYFSSPSAHYISISNATLSKDAQRFRTGKYGEVLHEMYDEQVYNNKCKYVFIGGSSTESRWVNEAKRWVALVDKDIKQNANSASAFNFGVGGQNLAQSLNRYNSFISELKPNYVFVMHEANDISKFLKGGYSVKEGSLHNLYDRKPLIESNFSRLRSILSSTLPFLSSQWTRYQNQSYIPERSRSLNTFNGMGANKAAKEYMARLLALKELVAAHGGALVLIEYPEVYEDILMRPFDGDNQSVRVNLKIGLENNSISEVDFINFLKEFRGQVHAIAKENHIPLINTKDRFGVLDFYDAIHFNEGGSEKFSRFIYKKLSRYNCDSGKSMPPHSR